MAKTKYYRASVTLPGGKRKFISAQTQEELNRKVTMLKMEIHAGVNIADETTFSDFAQLWVDTYKRPHLRESGLNDLLYTLNHQVMPYLGQYRVRDIKPMHIQLMMAGISHFSHKVQSKALAVTRAIFAAAVDNGLIVRSPVPSTLKARGEKTAEKVPLTREQSARLLKATEGLRIHVPVVLMLGLGLRREEALGLMWADVDFEKHCVNVRRTNVFIGNKSIISDDMKSDAARRKIPMPQWVEDELRAAARETVSLYVAPAADGRAMTQASFRRAWDSIKHRTTDDPSLLGTVVPKHPDVVLSLDFHVHPHLLRHTCITRWIEDGLTLKEAQYLAGHSSPDMTMRVYAHYDQAGQFNETVEKIRAAN